MHQPGFPWLCCPKLFDALICHGQACLAQGLLVFLWAGSPAPYIDCQLTVTCVLTTNFLPPALCANLHIVLHCPALYCPLWHSSIALYLYQLVLHHCVNLYPDKSPLCPWRPAPCLWRKQLSALIVQEKPHPDLIDPNPCCVTERSYFGSKLLADLGLLLVLLGTVWKDVSSKRPWFWFNCD